ncbi:COL12A1 [Bugula neritina]|uniref:COL12A1 n=1 Tax=Bugula neritina TaxID=10212 RepID=A0A7J7K151_BUGNE|nr:COL12A1 [Bugula neritina]
MKAVLFCLVLSFSTLVLVSESATTRLTYSRWINLLRYAHSSLQRDPTAVEDRQYNRTDHVQLIADSILKHFFNDIFTPSFTEDGELVHNYDRVPVDFLIMLDSSASIGSENFLKALQVLSTWIDILDEEDFSSDQLRVSMVSFSEPDQVIHEFAFSPALNKSSVISYINSTEYHAGSSTSTAQALWLADTIFSKHARPDAAKVMLMATDGWSHDVLELPFGVLWPAVRLRKLHGVQVFTLGIGDKINHNELEAICSKPIANHLFEVDDYDMMLEVLEKVKENQIFPF